MGIVLRWGCGVDIWEAVFEFFGPLADLTYQSFHDETASMSAAEIIKTTAALIALVGALYGLYKTAVLSIKGLEKVVNDFIDRHSRAVVTKRKKLGKEISLRSGGERPINKLDVAKLFDESMRLYKSRQIHRAEGVLKELVYHLNKKRAVALEYLEMTDEELVSAHLMSAELCCAQGSVGEALKHIESAKNIRPKSPEVWLYLGRLHIRRGDNSAAVEHLCQASSFATACSDETQEIEAQMYLSKAHLDTGANGLAWAAIRKSRGLANKQKNKNPDLYARICLDMAKVARRNGFTDKLSNALEDAKRFAEMADNQDIKRGIDSFIDELTPKNVPNAMPPLI